MIKNLNELEKMEENHGAGWAFFMVTCQKIAGIYWMNAALIPIQILYFSILGFDWPMAGAFLFLNVACFYRAHADRAAELKKEGEEQ